MHESGYDFCECDVKGCELKLYARHDEIGDYGWVIDQPIASSDGAARTVCLCPEHAIKYRQISNDYEKAMYTLLAEGR